MNLALENGAFTGFWFNRESQLLQKPNDPH